MKMTWSSCVPIFCMGPGSNFGSGFFEDSDCVLIDRWRIWNKKKLNFWTDMIKWYHLSSKLGSNQNRQEPENISKIKIFHLQLTVIKDYKKGIFYIVVYG